MQSLTDDAKFHCALSYSTVLRANSTIDHDCCIASPNSNLKQNSSWDSNNHVKCSASEIFVVQSFQMLFAILTCFLLQLYCVSLIPLHLVVSLWIIWLPVSGAFHSLFRTGTFLSKAQIHTAHQWCSHLSGEWGIIYYYSADWRYSKENYPLDQRPFLNM